MGNPGFNLSWNYGNLSKMNEEANAVARSQGLRNSNEIDAFRHAYVSAKFQEDLRNKVESIWVPSGLSNKIAGSGTYISGTAHEILTAGSVGNPRDEWAQDVDNNAVGRARENQLNKQGLSGAEKEKRLREEIAMAVRDGGLQINPTSSNQRYDYTQEPIEVVSEDIRTKLKGESSSVASKPKSTLGAVMERQFKKYGGKF